MSTINGKYLCTSSYDDVTRKTGWSRVGTVYTVVSSDANRVLLLEEGEGIIVEIHPLKISKYFKKIR